MKVPSLDLDPHRTKLQLLVRRGNEQANAFYVSLGFEESTSVMFQKWLDGRDTTPNN